MQEQIIQTRVLASMRSELALRFLAPALRFVRKPTIRIMIWSAWLGSIIGSLETVLFSGNALVWSPWLCSVLVLLMALVAVPHEIAHAAAVMDAGRPAPDIGIAFRPGIGVYAFTDLSRLGRQPRAVLFDVLLAGYDVNLAVYVLLFALAQLVVEPALVHGSLMVAHAWGCAMFLLTLYPLISNTDAGRIVRLLQQAPNPRPRLCRWFVGIWFAGVCLCTVWIVLLMTRATMVAAL